jgi:hypothetical protein
MPPSQYIPLATRLQNYTDFRRTRKGIGGGSCADAMRRAFVRLVASTQKADLRRSPLAEQRRQHKRPPVRSRPKRVAAWRSIKPRTIMCCAVACVMLAAFQSVSEARQKSRSRSGTVSAAAIEAGDAIK